MFELVSRPGGDILAEFGACLECSVSCSFHVSRSSGCVRPYAKLLDVPRTLGPHSSNRGASYPSTAPSLHPGIHTAFTAVHPAPHRPSMPLHTPRTPRTALTHSPRQNGGHAPNRLSTPHKAQRASLATCIPPVWVSESFGGLPVSSVHRLPLNLLPQAEPRRTRRATAGTWLML